MKYYEVVIISNNWVLVTIITVVLIISIIPPGLAPGRIWRHLRWRGGRGVEGGFSLPIALTHWPEGREGRDRFNTHQSGVILSRCGVMWRRGHVTGAWRAGHGALETAGHVILPPHPPAHTNSLPNCTQQVQLYWCLHLFGTVHTLGFH